MEEVRQGVVKRSTDTETICENGENVQPRRGGGRGYLRQDSECGCKEEVSQDTRP